MTNILCSHGKCNLLLIFKQIRCKKFGLHKPGKEIRNLHLFIFIYLFIYFFGAHVTFFFSRNNVTFIWTHTKKKNHRYYRRYVLWILSRGTQIERFELMILITIYTCFNNSNTSIDPLLNFINPFILNILLYIYI